MRKIIIVSIAFVFALNCAFAQEGNSVNKEEKEKKVRQVSLKTEILPQAGDIVIGLDMAQFAKSLINSVTNPNPHDDPTVKAFQSDFFVKYFVTQKSVIRGRLGINIANVTSRAFVRDDAAFLLNPANQDPLLQTKTVDVDKTKQAQWELGIGYEYRRSLWRVQGYVGGEIFGGMISNKFRREYGNPMTNENQNPSSAFTTLDIDHEGTTVTLGTNGYRVLEAKYVEMMLGAAAFFGADMFICRNLSIGAEFYLEGRYIRGGEVTAKQEKWLLNQAYVAEERYAPIGSAFMLSPGGRLNLMIYF